MKRFKVPIKKHISDFICTQNVWLTVNDQDMPLHIQKQDSSHQFLLGLSQREIIEDNSQTRHCTDNQQPIHQFKSLKENGVTADFILIDSKSGTLSLSLHDQAFWVLFRRSAGTWTRLKEITSDLHLEQDDFIIAFLSVISDEILNQVLEQSAHNSHIAISQMKELTKLAHDCRQCTLPLILINYTTNESYSFSIKSTLNAVSLTIDMIKNKVIKYHQEKLWQIETVLHEALVNAITYGNELDDSRLVDISYEIGYRGIRIWVRDTGEGFDVQNISVPVGDEALDRISGRGIYIMKKFSEAIFFNHKGNEILLYFDF